MSTPEIRNIRLDDLARLLDLYKHLHRQDVPPPAEARLSAIWRDMLTNPGFHCFVTVLQGRLVSSCTLIVVPNLTRGGRPYGLIENVVTNAEFRRRGLGKAVVAHALGKTWEAGCYKVMLLTGRTDPGVHQFYEACGFASDEKRGYVARPTDDAG